MKNSSSNINKSKLSQKEKSSKATKNWIRFIWISFACIVFAISFLFFSVSQGFLGEMPDIKELENPEINVASEIYSSDGKLLGKFEKEKTIPISYRELPPYLIYALQAKEDERFKEHSGIDLKSVERAIIFHGSRGGGSIITQQLAKLLFTGQASENKGLRFLQKLKEWCVAVSLERRYTKEEIITLYFNKFDFLFNAKGIGLASKVYFNKTPQELTLPEAATLVAMLENPKKNNPYRHPDKAKSRRNVVLKMMFDKGYIDEINFKKSIERDILVDYHPVTKMEEGYSAYYKFFLRKEIQKYLNDYEKETGKKLSLYKSGLKIYVTLDSKIQAYAEEAISEHLKKLQKTFDNEMKRNSHKPFYYLSNSQIQNVMISSMKRTSRYRMLKLENMSDDSIIMEFKKPIKMSKFTWDGEEMVEMSPWDSIRYHKQIVQAGLMSMNPSTGEIKAWVGGVNWKHFQFDHVKQGKRQVGSTFKPFVYATAVINNGLSSCSQISNSDFIKGKWRVSEGGGTYTLKQSVAKSLNPTAIRVLDEVGVDNVELLTKEMGITEKIPRNLTIALGTTDITIFEMVGAYSTFANFGIYTKPEMLWRIEDANGRVVKEVKPSTKEVMNEKHAYTMIDILKGPTEFGTASSELKRQNLHNEIAGKTGTTQNNSDGWFMGFVPKLATGVWVGWEDRATHFFRTGEGQGSKMALPIWCIFMKKIYNDKTLKINRDDQFPKPESWTNCQNQNYKKLKTIDEIKKTSHFSDKKTYQNVLDINTIINSSEKIDFNK